MAVALSGYLFVIAGNISDLCGGQNRAAAMGSVWQSQKTAKKAASAKVTPGNR
ncbi:MAG TPA: hypothetical protein VM120_16105 [Bryobacteraceae bacterium]|nr:hypothetical protein [Bryobacteraceae bacterium]